MTDDKSFEIGDTDFRLIQDMEATILVSSINDVNIAYEVSKMIQPHYFTNNEIGRAWALVLENLEANTAKNVNVATIQVEANRRKIDIDLTRYLALVTTDEDTVKSYASKIKDVYLTSYFDEQVLKIRNSAEGVSESVQKIKELANDVENQLSDVSLSMHISEMFEGLEEYLNSTEVPTIYGFGVPGVDEGLVDLAPGNTAIISASPGGGKTSLGIYTAVQNALKGIPVHFFSLEMSKRQITARIINTLVKVSAKKMLTKTLTDKEKQKIIAAKHLIKTLPLHVTPHPDMPLSTLLQSMRDSRLKYNTEIFIVDYIQLVNVVGRTKREEASLVAQRLKSAALELDASIVIMSQLKRIDKLEPDMFDLKETSDLEQSASLIAIMYPDKSGFFDKHKGENSYPIFFKIDKQRNGETFKRLLSFDPVEMSFHTITNADLDGYDNKSKASGDGKESKKDKDDNGDF